VGDCFIYNNAAWRLNYCVGGEVTTLFHLDKPLYLLGYLAAQSRVYLIDRWVSVFGGGVGQGRLCGHRRHSR
jgi:coatomer subunit beta'